ncbi:uncharacterized protein LOC112681523, partial [Sipha flava]|uniref:Uncharacterized protein LOC112681523 n=1 Tax=Sipha flava TaxID=143950 RepID=A0A8B8FAX4_9HEMI
MILDCYAPNITDGTWFSASKIAGPLDKEIIARNVARAYSGSEDSEDYVQNYNPDQSRIRKSTKRYSPESAASTITSKENNSKKKTNNQQSSKNMSLPEPPICPMETIKDLKNVSKIPTSVIDEHFSNVSEKPINKTFPLTKNTQQSSSINYTSEPEETSLTEMSEIWQIEYGCSIRNLKKNIQSKLEAILGLVSMLNATQAKMCTYLETLDKKINMVLEADKRLRALAFPQPKLSAAFIDLLPISTMEDLSEVERLLHPDSNDFMRNKEDLKWFWLFKIGNKHLNSAVRTAMSFVMTRTIAADFSLKGKTKLKFSNLNIFKPNISQDALSGYIKTPEDEVSFTDVVQNWLKHAPLPKTKCNTADTTTNEENTVQKNDL